MVKKRGFALFLGCRSGLAAPKDPVDFFLDLIIFKAGGREGVRRGRLGVFHERQKQVFGADILVRHRPRLVGRYFQHFLRSRRKGQHLPDGHHAARRGDRFFYVCGKFLKVNAHAAQNRHRDAVTFFDKAEQ